MSQLVVETLYERKTLVLLVYPFVSLMIDQVRSLADSTVLRLLLMRHTVHPSKECTWENKLTGVK